MNNKIPNKINLNHYKFIPGYHKNQKVIWVEFPYNPEWIKLIKENLKAHWSQSHKKWYLPDNPQNRKHLEIEADYIGKAIHHLSPQNLPELKLYIEQLKLKGYSPSTIKTYSTEFIQLLKILGNHPVHELSPERLRAYFLYCIDDLKLSENLIHSRMNAVKFYFEQVLNRPRMFLNIPRPKKPSILPKAISQRDIKKMFQQIENPKHQLLIKLCYGMGLRVSEIVNLKIEHIDSQRMQVLISGAKGKKDRYVVLPESILEELRDYYRQYRPVEYLFEGINGGQYSVRTVQQVFKTAMQKAKINKRVGVHSLRHSYATHLIEQGTDIRFVQDLLGHKNIKTTMNYTGLTDQTKRKIKSPLDFL